MYNKQLEQLINAALKDGTISEREKQVLLNEAQSLGININEFEEELTRRLHEWEKSDVTNVEENIDNTIPADKTSQKQSVFNNEFDISKKDVYNSNRGHSNQKKYDIRETLIITKKFLDTVKGSITNKMQNFIDKVKEKNAKVSHSGKSKVGKTFTDNDTNVPIANAQRPSAFTGLLDREDLSSKKLRKILDDIVGRDYMSEGDCESMSDFKELKAQTKRIKEALVQFPTPSDKGDLLDFMLYLKPKIKYSAHSDAFLMKYNECLERVELLYPGDPDFERIIDSKVKKSGWGKFRTNMKKTGMVMGGIGRTFWILLKIAGIIIAIIIVLVIILS